MEQIAVKVLVEVTSSDTVSTYNITYFILSFAPLTAFHSTKRANHYFLSTPLCPTTQTVMSDHKLLGNSKLPTRLLKC